MNGSALKLLERSATASHCRVIHISMGPPWPEQRIQDDTGYGPGRAVVLPTKKKDSKEGDMYKTHGDIRG